MRHRSATPLLALLTVVPLGSTSDAPRSAAHPAPARVVANDNRHPAGVLRAGVLTLRLDARLGEWHPDGDAAPGATVAAFAEEGRAPNIPGPLVRVPAGTDVALTIHNSLAQTLTLHGLDTRTAAASAPAGPAIDLMPGATRVVRFRLDAPGTYYYWGTTRRLALDWRVGDDAQLTGAMVVDPPNAAPAHDRIMVLGMWSDTVGRAFVHRSRVLAVVNGRSWPSTERFSYAVGDTVHWRVLNATVDAHPMHLHGFYYRVDSRGDGQSDTTYSPTQQRRVNTEALLPGATMTMTWVPERAGNWLFHCHLPEHFSARGSLGLPRAVASDEMQMATHGAMNHALQGMNGLVVGITVRGPSSGVTLASAEGARRAIRLLARINAGGTSTQPLYGFVLQEGTSEPPPDSGLHAGPLLVLERGKPVSITVVNRLAVPTSVHWHGIELESYYDGVAGFSGTATHLSPVVAPHDSFVARFTPPRAGTFIYHTHVDETRQQPAGLSGAIVVLEPGQALNRATDHTLLITTPASWDDEVRSVLVNGSLTPTAIEMQAGVPQRLRLVNVTASRPNMHVDIVRDSTLLQWRPIAKDGADLPEARRVARPARTAISVGETMDFEIVPSAGDLRVEMRAAIGSLLATVPIHVRPAP